MLVFGREGSLWDEMGMCCDWKVVLDLVLSSSLKCTCSGKRVLIECVQPLRWTSWKFRVKCVGEIKGFLGRQGGRVNQGVVWNRLLL